jgi:hypothetical protein
LISTTLVALSALICVAAVVMSIRGIWRIDVASYGDKSQDRGVAAIAGEGRFVLGLNVRSDWVGTQAASWPRTGENASVGAAVWLVITGDNEAAAWHSFAGFLLGWGPSHYPFVAVGFPAWFVALLGATPLAIRYGAKRRRSRRVAQGKCARCGYDLRGSEGNCPECGHPRGDAAMRRWRDNPPLHRPLHEASQRHL